MTARYERRAALFLVANHALEPVINVATDPRFGRFQEAFGEDPFVVGTMAVAAVLGLQVGPSVQFARSAR